MATIKQNGYSAAASQVLTTGLNALADAGQAVTTAIDNSSTLDLYDDVELAVTFASAPTAGKTVALFLLPSVDGSNYGDGDASTANTPSHFVGTFVARAVGTAQRLMLRGVQLPPGLFKYQLINNSGVAFTASGHTLTRRPYNLQVS
jgi:hypothetical protein